MERYVRTSVASDVEFLADRMRDEDVEEVRASNHTPLDALSLGLKISHPCYTLLDFSGTPFAMVGVAPSPLEGAGLIWMLGTKGIESVRFTFLKYSKYALQRIYDECEYELLYNYSYAKNSLHHQWLRWLGFKFLNKVVMPPNGEQFYEFARLKG